MHASSLLPLTALEPWKHTKRTQDFTCVCVCMGPHMCKHSCIHKTDMCVHYVCTHASACCICKHIHTLTSVHTCCTLISSHLEILCYVHCGLCCPFPGPWDFCSASLALHCQMYPLQSGDLPHLTSLLQSRTSLGYSGGEEL